YDNGFYVRTVPAHLAHGCGVAIRADECQESDLGGTGGVANQMVITQACSAFGRRWCPQSHEQRFHSSCPLMISAVGVSLVGSVPLHIAASITCVSNTVSTRRQEKWAKAHARVASRAASWEASLQSVATRR